jgi:mycothiol synthase
MRHLFMRRPTLDDLPPLPELPAGYTLRAYRPEDLDALSALMRTAFEDPQWSSDKLRRVLIDAPDVKRVIIIEFAGQPVATASARLVPDQHPDSGYVHWVAVDPAHRGHGLGYFVTLTCLYAFREFGCKDAVLETDDHRLAAIRIYQQLGFLPEERHPTHVERWAIVLANLLASANL